jgi:hypothetical protein
MKKRAVVGITLLFLMLIANGYADAIQQDKTTFSVENAQFEIVAFF